MRLLIVLLLALVVVAQDGILVKIAKYKCADLRYDSTPASTKPPFVLLIEPSTLYLPDKGPSFTYETLNLYAKSEDNTRVGRFSVRMYCVKENVRDIGSMYAWNGTFSGTVWKNSSPVTIQTTILTPLVIGRISSLNGRVSGRLGLMANFNINVGAALPEFAFAVTLTDQFDCAINMVDAGTGLSSTYGCLNLSDLNPNLVTTLGEPICQSFSEDPIVESNCGSPQIITRAEENQQTISEGFSVSTTTTTSINVGKNFQVGRGVGKKSTTNPRSISGTTTETTTMTTSRGYTEENSEQSSRLSTSVGTTSRNKRYTLGNSRQVKEFATRQDCVATGTAKGCLDTECTVAIQLDYESKKSTITTRHEMSALSCDVLE